MRDAAHRLQSTNLLVRDVAYEFGFEDPFQFSRTFHRILGVSPRQFKRLQQRGQ
jgi:transcriptional regulator GlxA family with amidase domain